MTRMHADEVSTDAALVRRLLVGQFPHWAELPIEPVSSFGTDNALYRLGVDMVVRLPRIDWAVGATERDLRWLPALAPLLAVEIPRPLGSGVPAEGYPWPWGVYTWLEGEDARDSGVDPGELARFVVSLRELDLSDGPPAGRGAPLRARDAETRRAISRLEGEIDVQAAIAAWEAALEVPDWPGLPKWVHGDLLAGNLLLRNGRLTGVIDWSGVGVGDPAADLMGAWSLFESEERNAFRAEVEVDDRTWARGRGLALSQGLVALPYYKETNPVLAGIGRRAIANVLASLDE